MAVLKTLAQSVYTTFTGYLTGGRKRLAELYENTMNKSDHQQLRWVYGCITGDTVEQAAALTELAEIHGTSITTPTNTIGSTVTELNTRRGKAVALTSGNNTVTFASTFSDANYTLTFIVYTASGGQVQWTHSDSDETASGFDIWVAAACKINYTAIYN